MSDFSAPADNLVREATGYLNAQLDNVKLRTVKGLSKGTSAIAKLLLIFIVAGALVTALSFAIILLLGELIGSYAGAAFIVSGILLIAIVLLIALRNRIFKNSFIGMYTDVFYQDDTKPQGINSHEDLDEAIRKTETRIKEEEANISNAYTQAKAFYTPKHLISASLGNFGFGDRFGGINLTNLISKIVLFFLGRKR